MTRPWLVQFGPLIMPTEAREELRMTAHNLSDADYKDVIWAERDLAVKRRRPHRHGWPKTWRTAAGKFRLVAPPATQNVTALKKRAP